MGEVLSFPTPQRKKPECASCGRAIPTFEVMVVGPKPQELTATLEATYKCECGSDVTVKMKANF